MTYNKFIAGFLFAVFSVASMAGGEPVATTATPARTKVVVKPAKAVAPVAVKEVAPVAVKEVAPVAVVTPVAVAVEPAPVPAPAPAVSAKPASFAVEYEHENVNHSSDNNSIAFIPGYKLDNGIKLDFKMKGGQADASPGNHTVLSFEPRVKYMWDINDIFALGGRVSVGEVLQDSGNYSFYTIEPIAEWQFADRWLANLSYKWKDATGDRDNADSSTVYLGAGYKVTADQTVSAKVYDRNANAPNSDSTGIEVNYAIAF